MMAIDIDNVTLNTQQCLLDHYNRETGLKVTMNDPRLEGFYIENIFNVPRSEVLETIGYIYPDFQPGFLEVMKGRTDFYFLTARDGQRITNAKEILRPHFPDTPIIPTPAGTKYRHEADLFIEDDPKDLEQFESRGLPYLVFSRPWNVPYQRNGNHFDHWKDVNLK